MRVLEESPGGDAGLMLTTATHPQLAAVQPCLASLALRANEPLGPPQPKQVLSALFFRGEALLKLNQILGEIFGHPQPLRVGPT